MKEARPREEGFGVALVQELERRFGVWGLRFEEMGDEFDGVAGEEAA